MILDPLAQLKDIHLPEPISFWPPAIGWWLLVLALLSALFGLCYLLRRYLRKGRYRRHAIKALTCIHHAYQTDKNPIAYSLKINSLLKQVAITCYGKEVVSRLTDAAWLAFLDERAGVQDFSRGAGRVLAIAPYAESAKHPALADIDDGQALYQCCGNWIRKHR